MAEVSGARTFRVPAEAYDRHIGRYSTALASALVTAAQVRAGDTVLDVGCGPGALTGVLAQVAGPGCVAAVDPLEPFVVSCRRRVPGADVRVGVAEVLPFESGRFDAVLAQLVVNFMTDAPAGVREMCRVTRPGGVVAACVWDYAGEMTLLRRFWDAAIALDPRGAGPCDEGRVMRYCRPDELAALWGDAGLSQVRTDALIVTAAYADFDDLWAPIAAGVAPSGAYAVSLEGERREDLRAEFHRRLGAPDGPFELAARAWCVTGRRPQDRPLGRSGRRLSP